MQTVEKGQVSFVVTSASHDVGRYNRYCQQGFMAEKDVDSVRLCVYNTVCSVRTGGLERFA